MSFPLSRRITPVVAGLIALALTTGLAACGESSSTRQRNAVVGEVAVPCTLGGRGPTGGVVISLATSTSGTSVESAPANWTPMPQTNWAEMIKRASEYRAGGFSDWKLPTKEQMTTLGNRLVQYVGGDLFWSSTGHEGSTWKWMWRDPNGLTLADPVTGGAGAGTAMQAVPVRNFTEANTPCMAVVATTTIAPTTTLSATTTTTTIAPTTTAVALKCAVGGTCAVGDTGPGGGKVFYVSPSQINAVTGISTGGKYLEAAPNTWSGATADPSLPWCDKTTTMIGNNSGLGQGAANTKKMIDACSSTSAAKVVADLSFNNRDDWFLPSAEELSFMWRSRDVIGGFNNSVAYWSSSEVTGNGAKAAQRLVFNPVKWLEDTKVGNYLVRPIRAFSEGSVPAVAPAATLPAITVAPTTTQAASKCATGGKCVIGDKGPGGGIVFYVSPNEINSWGTISTGGTFLEAAPNTWSGATADPSLPWCDKTTTMIGNNSGLGQGAANTKKMIDACSSTSAAKVVADLSFNNRDDWFLPSAEELSLMWRSRDVIGGFNNSVAYWSSSEVTGNGAKAAQRLVFNPVKWLENTKVGNYLVRPIRAFSEGSVPAVAPAATIPATTTTSTIPLAPACASISSCKVGERGPGDSIIISATFEGPTSRYLAIARDGWNGTLIDPKMTLDEAKTAVAAYRPNGQAGWTLPSYLDKVGSMGQILQLCRYAHNSMSATSNTCDETKPLRANWSVAGDDMSYWTSHPTAPSGAAGYGAIMRVRDSSVWANTPRTRNYVRPVLEFSYTAPPIPTTTTTLPQKCAQGGICKIGDVSPTGGLIVKFFGSGSNITYTEIAPRDWDDGLAGVDNGNGGDPLTKKATAASLVSKYRGGGKTDWHLADIGEMRDAFTVTEEPKFTAATEKNGQRSCKVTSATGMPNWNQWGFYASYWIAASSPLIFSYPTGGVYPVVDSFDVSASEWQHYVRPVRTGKYTGPAMSYKNPTYSPAECETVAMATTTTTPTTRTCAQGGPCRVGDVGQRGGIVISVDNSKPRGQRNVEIAKFGWKFGRDDCAGTSLGFACNTGEWDPIAAGSIGDGYRLPTVAELQAVSRLPSATRNQLQLIDHYYWTSESSGKNMNVKLALDSGIGVDDKNKLRREPNATNSYSLVDAHWAVKISTGFTVSETYAYTRPVRAF